MKLLHRHLSALVLSHAPPLAPSDRDLVRSLAVRAGDRASAAKDGLDALPALPQLRCPLEHGRLALRLQRATLALGVLERLR